MPSLKSTRLDPSFLARPIAHRGLHDKVRGIIENSRSAFAAAIERSLPIELDVQASGDDRAVVFHDPALERLTHEKGKLSALKLSALQAITLKGGDDRIQSFGEMLEQLAGQVPLLIEIKDQSGELGSYIGGFVDDIIAGLRGYKGAVALMSFNPYIIADIREKWPDACLGLVTDNFNLPAWRHVPKARIKRLNQLAEIPNLELDFISHNVKELKLVEDVELPKLCWTVKSQEGEIKARKIADNITFEGYIPEGI